MVPPQGEVRQIDQLSDGGWERCELVVGQLEPRQIDQLYDALRHGGELVPRQAEPRQIDQLPDALRHGGEVAPIQPELRPALPPTRLNLLLNRRHLCRSITAKCLSHPHALCLARQERTDEGGGGGVHGGHPLIFKNPKSHEIHEFGFGRFRISHISRRRTCDE